VLALAAAVGLGVWATRPAADRRPEPQPPVAQEPPAPAQSQPEPEVDRKAVEFTRVMTEATTAEQASRWADARARYQEALTLMPDHSDARAGLARMAARLAPPAPAPAPVGPAARKADGPSAEDRVRANGLVRRATSKYEAGDYDGAIADLNQALVSVPGHDGAATLLKAVLRAKDTEAKMPRRPPGR
jgi:tetratricopeptide (TPR) repeat protein